MHCNAIFFFCGGIRVGDADGTILNAEEIKKAREELARRGYAQPDIVCNGYPSGRGAEVHGFSEKARSWLRENVTTGRWIAQGQAVQVPVEQVSKIVKEASEAGLHVETNNV
jgi:hypothetical protein